MSRKAGSCLSSQTLDLMKRLTLIGVVLSLAWGAFFLCLLYWKRESVLTLTLNEWGDFFAGAVAPVALFWLVLGYIQQGEELRLNTEALRAQQEELRRQVEETATLALNAERQAAATEQLALATKNEVQRAVLKEEAESMPLFRSGGGSGSGGRTELNVRNAGATVKRLSVTGPPGVRLQLKPTDLFQHNLEGALVVESVSSYPFTFTIRFSDLRNVEREQMYEMISQFSFVEVQSTSG